ncbi:nucleotide sugar dehydrogenase [Gammaproteobacteria bacterium]|nr:nucleotide sugar dehydrogenase [Gammaproteobacteria bacterium]
MKNKIYIIGAGYVGFTLGVALSKRFKAIFIEKNAIKVQKVKNQTSLLKEINLTKEFKKNFQNISISNDLNDIKDDSFVFLALPTDYDVDSQSFNTDILDEVIDWLSEHRPKCIIVIKSTIPIGYTKKTISRTSNNNIYFSPEFLREGSSYKDLLNPDRIIVSPNQKYSKKILNILSSISSVENKSCLIMDSKTAESIKLFSNAFLAMRVAFFNELDSFAIKESLNSKDLIKGVSLDKRIGMSYNNPSFGYGGYCLPKDTKQLSNEVSEEYSLLPLNTVNSNLKRVSFLAKDIFSKYAGKSIGIYRLSMKAGSDNIRSSSSMNLLLALTKLGKEVNLFEPLLDEREIKSNNKIIFHKDLESFKKNTEVIICNRPDKLIKKAAQEIYSRNIFDEN